MEKIKLTKENINQFQKPNWQRWQRISSIQKFVKLVSKGDFLESSVITVNKLNGNLRIINGSHRIGAIKKYLDKNPTKSVTLHLEIFENLTENQEKELYDKLATETPQTCDDLLQIHKNEIPLWKWVKEDFPININIYTNPMDNSLKFRNLLQGIFSTMNGRTNFDINSRSYKEVILSRALMIGEQEYNLAKDFFEIYVKSVGGVLDNPLYKQNVLIPMMNIYIINTKRDLMIAPDKKIKEEDWIKLFKKCMKDYIILSNAEIHISREKLVETRERILYLANHGTGKVGFI